MRLLFWNTNKKNIDDYISRIIQEQKIDVFCAAEYSGNIKYLCKLLEPYKQFEEIVSPGCDRIIILGNPDDFSTSFQNSHYSMQFFRNDYLLCILHLPSKLHSDACLRREVLVTEILEKINSFEDNKGNDKIVIVGDFNVNPYEDLCLRVDKFHSIPYETEVKRKKRTFCGKEFKMFYNPMWNIIGDESIPYGTFYFASSDAICPYWNIYDQVLIRPSLISRFKKNELKILTKCKNDSLVDKNNYPKKEISDHLPIVFELED